MQVKEAVKKQRNVKEHPMNALLRMDRIPHIWCGGCGIGTAVSCFAQAMERAEVDVDNMAICSGIGCTGRVAGYMRMDSFHTTHGRSVPFATGLALASPKTKVVVFSGDGDLIAIGGNHFIHAARRNMDLLVICVNNFIYGMTGGQVTPTTPEGANASTTPYGNFENTFNLPYLAASCGATYVARYTSLHTKRMTWAMSEALNKKGFRFIEIIGPCTTLYARRNRLGDGLNLMKFYHDTNEVNNLSDLRELDIRFQEKIIIGKFIDEERPTWLDCMNNRYRKVFGESYEPYEGAVE